MDYTEIHRILSLSTGRSADRLPGMAANHRFFTAPASTRHHWCRSAAWVQHSVNVYEVMMEKHQFWKPIAPTCASACKHAYVQFTK